VRFLVSIFESSGKFELSEGGSVAVSGHIRIPEAHEREHLTLPVATSTIDKPLETNDVYKELRLRGYDYSGLFQGIRVSDNLGTNLFFFKNSLIQQRFYIGVRGTLDWSENWISFMDTILQFSILGQNTRELYLPTRLQRALIDPMKHRQILESTPDNGKY
jgi:fatty acid synthase